MIQIEKAHIVTEPIELQREQDVEKYQLHFEKQVDVMADEWKLSFFDKIGLWIENGAKYTKLVFLIIKIFTKIGLVMATSNDKKTTHAGIIKVIITSIVAVISIFFSVDIPQDIQATLIGVVVGIWGLIEFFQSFFTNKEDKK